MQEVPKLWKPLHLKTFHDHIVEFFGPFLFQNDVFKLQPDFSELRIRVFLENRLGNFQTFLISQI
jgi:hypothetical protein